MLGLTVGKVCDGVKAVDVPREALGCRKMGWEIGMDGQTDTQERTGLEDLRDRSRAFS